VVFRSPRHRPAKPRRGRKNFRGRPAWPQRRGRGQRTKPSSVAWLSDHRRC